MSSTTTGGSDESTSSSPGRDEDEGDLLVESEDEIDKPITHVEGVTPGRRRNSLSPTSAALYSWKEVSCRTGEKINTIHWRVKTSIVFSMFLLFFFFLSD